MGSRTRIGKFSKDGKPRAMPATTSPIVVIGTFILAFGWFGFNPGSTLAGTDTPHQHRGHQYHAGIRRRGRGSLSAGHFLKASRTRP